MITQFYKKFNILYTIYFYRKVLHISIKQNIIYIVYKIQIYKITFKLEVYYEIWVSVHGR